VPLTVALLMTSAAEPELESVRLCVVVVPTLALPKLNEDALNASAGEPVDWAAVPVPLSGMVTVGSLALLEMVSNPESTNAEVGAKVVLKVWLLPGPRSSGNLIPEILNVERETAMDETVKDSRPVFVICKVCVDVVPTVTLPKLN